MKGTSFQISVICECIEECFSFIIWIDDFAKTADPEDMQWGLGEACELISRSTMLYSFLSLRKLDDFICPINPKADDLCAEKMGIDVSALPNLYSGHLLSSEEREQINKSVAHLTQLNSIEMDSEVDLTRISLRCIPVFRSLLDQLRTLDKEGPSSYALEKARNLIARATALYSVE